jgi:hypothetical protein
MVFGGGAMWALVKRSAQRGEKLGEEGTRLGEENKASIKEHGLRLEGVNKDISHLSGTVARLQVEHDGLEIRLRAVEVSHAVVENEISRPYRQKGGSE